MNFRTIRHTALTLLVLLWLSACASRPPVDPTGPADVVRAPQQVSRLPGDPPQFALASLAAALGSMERYETSHGVALLQLLEDLPSASLNRIPDTPDAANSFQHWPQLAVTIRETLVREADLALAAQAWGAEHPGHAVTESGFVDLAEAYRDLFALPSRIGVLLPNEGGLASAGKAIRDGLLSSYLQQPRGVQLRFYPTAEDPQSAVAAYFSALNDGAQWIIGPLRRESVEALSGLGSLGVPLLLLNDPANAERQFTESLVFSLSLAQEMEARAIADQALENGLKSALVLAADSPW
ncbi:MAG TPA: penicillin-binding protein activator, partial [Xanthomonadales bacterium]|nr:penicillin-binding protein activator [Xanthomonadales bacterium]